MLRYLIVLTLLAASVFLFKLGNNPLQSWDESVYAESAKEMVQTGQYLTPQWNGEKFLQKPPLAMWATAIMFQVAGVNEFTARLFSALCGVGCVVLTFLIGSLFLSRGSAFVGGLILSITPHFYNYARQGSLDVPLAFFMLLCLFAYLKAKEDSRWWLLFGVSGGLAVMTKGVAAAPLFVALIVTLLIMREQVWRSRYFSLGLGLLVIVAGAWHLAMFGLYGSHFLNEYVSQQIFARSSAALDADPQSPVFYLKILALGFLPFTLLIPFAAVRIYRQRQFPIILLLLAGVMVVMYSIVATKHPWYVVPVYPIFALVLASLKRNKGTAMLGAVLAIVAMMHCQLLDRFLLTAHPKERAAVALSLEGQGPLVTEMYSAPAVLFYSNRKICTLPTDPHVSHSMRPLTVCR